MDLTSLYFSSKGRISRKVYWLASLPLLALYVVAELLRDGEASLEDAVLALIVLLVLMVPNVTLAIKRCHDRGKSGWFVLISFIPVIGSIWLLVELGFLRGSEGENRFGPDPLAATPDAVLAS
jgi:uncharacterized membrane protein YhaH (DUF805 family)